MENLREEAFATYDYIKSLTGEWLFKPYRKDAIEQELMKDYFDYVEENPNGKGYYIIIKDELWPTQEINLAFDTGENLAYISESIYSETPDKLYLTYAFCAMLERIAERKDMLDMMNSDNELWEDNINYIDYV